MIWFTWRQQRLEAMIFSLTLVLVTMVVLKTGLDMAATFRRLGVAACIGAPVDDPRCGDILAIFQQRFDLLNRAFYAFELTPIGLAMLLAAPYTQDLEQGTYRLVWTQGITRRRWLLTRAALLGTVAALAALACSLLMTWWHGPLDRLSGARFSPLAFDTEGLVPIAYTAFALALVLAIGTVLRRTIPALATALVIFVAIRAAIELLVRPRYLAPIEVRWVSGSIPISPHDWLIRKGDFRDRLGHVFSFDQVNQLCGSPSTSVNLSPVAIKDAYISCYNHYGLAEIVRYQPAGRYWLFQGIESGIFLGLAAGLLALSVWWVRARYA